MASELIPRLNAALADEAIREPALPDRLSAPVTAPDAAPGMGPRETCFPLHFAGIQGG